MHPFMYKENGSAGSNLLQGFELCNQATVLPQMLPLMHSKHGISVLTGKQDTEALFPN